MKLDIPYYIRQVLREQRKVYVPGIGTFRLEQSASDFSADKTSLLPPSIQLAFEEGESTDQSLLTYMLDGGLWTEEKAKKKLDQYTNAAFNKLLNVDSFVVEGLGRLVKKPDTDVVAFEPQVDVLTREFKGLQPISLKPISRLGDQMVGTAPLTAQPDEGSGSYIWRIILLAILLISLFFLGKAINGDFSGGTDDPKTELMDDGVDELGGGQNPDDLDQKYAEIDELIEPISSGDVDVSDLAKNPLDSSAKVNGNINRADSGTEKSIQEGGSRIDLEDSAENGVLEVTTQKPANKHADIIPASGECVIIVGSFIKSLNAIKMASLLERKGFTVYQSEYEGFKRVGLKYTCIDEDLEAYLQNIRKNISKKAWYLSPELEVPYER